MVPDAGGRGVNCVDLERLLDECELDRLPVDALAHAAECESCARSLARARSLAAALAAHFSRVEAAPAGFADRVMARVRRGEARGVRWLTLPDAMPWWTRAAAEPSVALALAVAALLLWRGDRWLAAARASWPALAGAPGRLHDGAVALGFGPVMAALARPFAAAAGSPWAVQLGLVLGVAPLVALAGWMMWRAGEQLVDAVTAPVTR